MKSFKPTDLPAAVCSLRGNCMILAFDWVSVILQVHANRPAFSNKEKSLLSDRG